MSSSHDRATVFTPAPAPPTAPVSPSARPAPAPAPLRWRMPVAVPPLVLEAGAGGARLRITLLRGGSLVFSAGRALVVHDPVGLAGLRLLASVARTLADPPLNDRTPRVLCEVYAVPVSLELLWAGVAYRRRPWRAVRRVAEAPVANRQVAERQVAERRVAEGQVTERHSSNGSGSKRVGSVRGAARSEVPRILLLHEMPSTGGGDASPSVAHDVPAFIRLVAHTLDAGGALLAIDRGCPGEPAARTTGGAATRSVTPASPRAPLHDEPYWLDRLHLHAGTLRPVVRRGTCHADEPVPASVG